MPPMISGIDVISKKKAITEAMIVKIRNVFSLSETIPITDKIMNMDTAAKSPRHPNKIFNIEMIVSCFSIYCLSDL